nr:hypothetical protein [uncultured bacterium]
MFTTIDTENFESEIITAKDPVLLACIRRDHELKEQLELLENISKENSKLKICILHEDFSEIYKILRIEGTPTFLIFLWKEEKGRLLGKVNISVLTSFIAKSLNMPSDRRSGQISMSVNI